MIRENFAWPEFLLPPARNFVHLHFPCPRLHSALFLQCLHLPPSPLQVADWQEGFDYYCNELCLGNMAPCEFLSDFYDFIRVTKIVPVASNEYNVILEFKKCLRPKNVDSLTMALQAYGHTHKSCSLCYPFLVLFLEHFYDDVGLPPWAQRICCGPAGSEVC